MKNRLYFWLRAALFGCVLGAVLALGSLLLTPKYYQEDLYPTTSTFREFYRLEKNSADVLFLGSSHAVAAFDPQVLYDEWGLTSYNLGSEQQSAAVSWYWLEEALRFQQPAAVVLDTYFLFPYAPDTPFNARESFVRKAMDFMRPSSVKLRAAMEIARLDPAQSVVSYLFPGVRYHDRLNTLTEKDYALSRLFETEGLNGFGMLFGESGDEDFLPFDANPSAVPMEMVPFMAECLDRITALCKARGIELVLVKTPALGQTVEKNTATQAYADEHGLTFVDFNESSVYYSELEYDFCWDNADNEHANVWGAEKITDYLGGVLTELLEVEAHEHPYWEKSRERHEARLADE